MHNSKLNEGLVPIKTVDKNNVSRTVYIRRDDAGSQRAETPVEIASRELLAERDHYERTNCEAARVLKLGATIEEADHNMRTHVKQAEDDPDLMKKPAFRDRMIAFLGYSQERAKAKRRLANREHVESSDKSMLDQVRDGDISVDEHVDTARAQQRFPGSVKANGSLVTETRVDDGLADEINAAVEQAERKQNLDAKARANKSKAADDDAKRVERAMVDYARDDLDEIDQLSVEKAQRKIDENLARKRRRRALKREREQERLAELTHSSGNVNVKVKPAGSMSIYELHARLDELIHRGDGSNAAAKSRQAQAQIYSHLVKVQMSQQQRQQQRRVHSMEEKLKHKAQKDSLRDQRDVQSAEKKKDKAVITELRKNERELERRFNRQRQAVKRVEKERDYEQYKRERVVLRQRKEAMRAKAEKLRQEMAAQREQERREKSKNRKVQSENVERSRTENRH